MFFVYRHLRLDNGQPFYIGKGKTNVKAKNYITEHYRAFSTQKRNPYWKNIVAKCGYEVEIMFEHISENVVFEKEKEFIEIYGRKDINRGLLSNMSEGGEGNCGRTRTQEHSDNISKAKLGVSINLSVEGRERLSRANRGKNNFFYGKHLSHWKGRKHSEETIKNHFEGENNPFYGKTHTKEFLREKTIASSFRVKVVEKGEETIFECVPDCAKHFKCTISNIYSRDGYQKKGKTAVRGVFKGIYLEILK